MLIESLVAYSCLVGKGCEDTSHAYYLSSPILQEMAHNSEEKAKHIIGQSAVLYLLPLATLAVTDKASVKLSNHFSVDLSKSESLGKLTWTY